MDLQVIQNKIFEVRGCRVMLDFHLAELYQVEVCPLERGSQLVVIHRGVTKCDTPGLQLWRSLAYGFHRTGRSHAFIRLAQPDRHRGEHFHHAGHAGICPYASDGRRV